MARASNPIAIDSTGPFGCGQAVSNGALANANCIRRACFRILTSEEPVKQMGTSESDRAPEADLPAGARAQAEPMDRRRKTMRLLLAAFCVSGVVLNLGFAVSSVIAGYGGGDFSEFYSASRLAGTGRLYDWDALRRLEEEHAWPLPCGRLPVVSFALKPLTFLNYQAARYLWLAISVAALFGIAWMWPRPHRSLMMAALAWSTPAAFVLVVGQDTLVWLALFGLVSPVAPCAWPEARRKLSDTQSWNSIVVPTRRR